jgi:hypothetical protein
VVAEHQSGWSSRILLWLRVFTNHIDSMTWFNRVVAEHQPMVKYYWSVAEIDSSGWWKKTPTTGEKVIYSFPKTLSNELLFDF